jgi:L-fucose isomerase
MIPKVALISLTSTGSEVQGEDRLGRAQKFTREAVEVLNGLGVELMQPVPIATTPSEVHVAVRAAEAWNADCIVLLFTGFITPDWVMLQLREKKLPLALWCVPCINTWPLVGAALCRGAIADCGWQHRWFYGDTKSKAVKQVYDFCRGAMLAQRLKGKKYGFIGGRTYGMYSAVFDYVQLMRQFGIDVHHVDQMDLYLRSEAQDAKAVGKTMAAVTQGMVVEDVRPMIMERSVREYLSLKDMVKEYGWDFVGIKCQPEMTYKYCGVCLGMALLNDDGISTTCETDTSGAITNYMLQMLTDEIPFMGDTADADMEAQIITLANCGAMATKLAAPGKPVRITEQYLGMGPMTGACTTFQAKPGAATITRLFRCQGEYSLMMSYGEIVNLPDSKLSPGRERWPHAFIKFPGNIEAVVGNLLANHLHIAYGDYIGALTEACNLMEIKPLPL